MNSASYNSDCNGEMRWDDDDDGADDGDDVDDDLDDARDDGDDDGDDLPFREVISPAESARRKGLFVSGGFRLQSGGGTPDPTSVLGFLGHEDDIGQRGAPEVGPTP